MKSIVTDYPGEIEYLFIDGGSTDSTLSILNEMKKEGYPLRVLNNPERNAASAMNIGIRASKGDYIVRVDAHAGFPEDYVKTLVTKMISSDDDVENVGGICLTLPAGSSSIARSIAYALSSPFGMGDSLFRIGVEETREADTVPFGCFRRSLFDRIGFFNENLIRNQDDEFNGRIIKNGGRILLLPDVKIKYYPRESFIKLSKMFFQYGFYKPLVGKCLGRPATLRQFAPPFFLIALVIPLLLSFFDVSFIWITSVVMILWLMVALAAASRNSLSLFILSLAAFLIVHLSYGAGYLAGIFRWLPFKTAL